MGFFLKTGLKFACGDGCQKGCGFWVTGSSGCGYLELAGKLDVNGCDCKHTESWGSWGMRKGWACALRAPMWLHQTGSWMFSASPNAQGVFLRAEIEYMQTWNPSWPPLFPTSSIALGQVGVFKTRFKVRLSVCVLFNPHCKPFYRGGNRGSEIFSCSSTLE